MSDIKIDTCPICGGHSFSPLAAGQYMCTQCGYVVNDGSDSSQAPSSSSSSSSDSLQESPLSTEEEPSPEVNMDQTRCPRCGSVVDKGLNFVQNADSVSLKRKVLQRKLQKKVNRLFMMKMSRNMDYFTNY